MKTMSVFGMILALSVVGSLYIVDKLFEYSLWVMFKIDIPWYGDLLGGMLTNAFILPISFICWVLEIGGYPIPLIHKS